MSPRRALLPCLLAAALLQGASHHGDASPPPPPTLALVFTTQTHGALEPCDCVLGMLGGLPRRLAALDRLRARHATLHSFDLGDLTHPHTVHPALLDLQTTTALELLQLADTAALAPGEQDLRLDLHTLTRHDPPWVNANLRDPQGDAPFPLARVLDPDAERPIWVTAWLDPWLGDPQGRFEALPLLDALQDAQRAVPPPTGAIRLALVHGDLPDLPPDLPLDVIAYGHDLTTPRPLERHGDTWLVPVVRDARQLSVLTLDPTPRLDLVPLDAHVPDHPAARARVDAYYRQAAGLPAPPRNPAPAGGTFVGSATCAACHPDEAAVFQDTLHAGSYERITLMDERAALPQCTSCHVTGYGFQSGFQSLERTPDLAEVGCESCHGVGEAHTRDPSQNGYGLLPGGLAAWQPTCLRCHDATNSPDFDFEHALPLIQHWADR